MGFASAGVGDGDGVLSGHLVSYDCQSIHRYLYIDVILTEGKSFSFGPITSKVNLCLT